MAKAKKKAVASNGSTTLAELLSQHSKAGFEETQASDFAIPMLSILQKGSPQVDEDDEAYIDGSKPGLIFHNIRKSVHEEINVIPVKYRKVFLEWVTREGGGGFRGEHSFADGSKLLHQCTKDDKGRMILENGNQLSETANYYCLYQFAEGQYEPVMISMASTNLKVSRNWLSQLDGMTYEEGGQVHADLPINAYGWTMTSSRKENDKGVWWVWKPEAEDFVLISTHEKADSFRDSVETARIAYNPVQESAEENAM